MPLTDTPLVLLAVFRAYVDALATESAFDDGALLVALRQAEKWAGLVCGYALGPSRHSMGTSMASCDSDGNVRVDKGYGRHQPVIAVEKLEVGYRGVASRVIEPSRRGQRETAEFREVPGAGRVSARSLPRRADRRRAQPR